MSSQVLSQNSASSSSGFHKVTSEELQSNISLQNNINNHQKNYLNKINQQPQLLIKNNNNPLLQSNNDYTHSVQIQESRIRKEIKQLKSYNSNITSQSNYPTQTLNSSYNSNLLQTQNFSQSFKVHQKQQKNQKKGENKVNKSKDISQIPQINTTNLNITKLRYENQAKQKNFPFYQQSKVKVKLPSQYQSQIDFLPSSLQRNNTSKSQIFKKNNKNKFKRVSRQNNIKIEQKKFDQKINEYKEKRSNKYLKKQDLKTDLLPSLDCNNEKDLENTRSQLINASQVINSINHRDSNKRNKSLKKRHSKNRKSKKKQSSSVIKIDQKQGSCCNQCQIM